MHRERRHFVLLCGGAARWENPSLLSAIAGVTVTSTEHPASTTSESMSEEVQGNLSRGPAESENSDKNGDNEEVPGNLSHDRPEWLQEFRHGLVDESVPEHRDASSSSHELLSEPRAKLVSGKHSFFYSLPEGPKLRYLLENKNWKDFLQKTHWRSRTSRRKSLVTW